MLCLLFTIDVQASPPSCIRPHTNQHLAVRWYWTYLSKTKLVVSRLQSNKDWNIAMYNVCWFVFVFNKRHTHTHLYYICVIYPCVYIYTHLCVYVCLCMHACVYMYIYIWLWLILYECVCVCIVYAQWNNHPLHKSSTHPHIHQSAVSGTLDQQVKSWLKFDFKNPTVS